MRIQVGEVVTGIGSRRVVRLDVHHGHLIPKTRREQTNSAVEIDERPDSPPSVTSGPDCVDQRCGPVGARLEERIGRDAEGPTVDDVGEPGSTALAELVGPDDSDVVRQPHVSRDTRLEPHQALAGRGGTRITL